MRRLLKVHTTIGVAVSLIICLSAGKSAASDSDVILNELQRDDWEVRLMNGHALEKMQEPQSTEMLVEVVDKQRSNWKLQMRGISLLARIHTPRAEDVLLQLFYDIFFHHGCPALKSSLAVALGNFSGSRVAEALIQGLDDPELQVREASIVSLGRVGDAAAVPYLIGQLGDRHFAIKVSAIRSLGLLRDARAVSSLEKMAGSAGEPLLRREASVALSMIRKQAASVSRASDVHSLQSDP